MDGVHLPQIVKSGREPLFRSEQSQQTIKKKITPGESAIITHRLDNNPRDKRRSTDREQFTRKKRSSVERHGRLKTKKFSGCGGKVKGTRSEGKTQNTRGRNEGVGLPKIGSSGSGVIVRNTFDSEGLTVKKARHRQSKRDGRGDTISYVYSKSLKDENCMAFLRNCMDLEKGSPSHQRSSVSAVATDKKPYGLPSLKAINGEFTDTTEMLSSTDDNGQETLTESESLLDRWETLDDMSNTTNYEC